MRQIERRHSPCIAFTRTRSEVRVLQRPPLNRLITNNLARPRRSAPIDAEALGGSLVAVPMPFLESLDNIRESTYDVLGCMDRRGFKLGARNRLNLEFTWTAA